MKKNIFISFIEEAVLNPQYHGYIGGRIEVYRPKDEYASEEIRFFTDKPEKFNIFRDRWDMKKVSEAELKSVKRSVSRRFSVC